VQDNALIDINPVGSLVKLSEEFCAKSTSDEVSLVF